MPTARNLAAAALYPLLYLIGCAALAAVAAYPVFVLAGSGDNDLFRILVSRGGQVFLILGLYPLARRLRLGVSDLGLVREFPRQLAVGFMLGTLMLVLHLLVLLALDIRAVNRDGFTDAGRFFAVLAKALATGCIVALLEETIFRGVLFAAVRKTTGTVIAVTISSFYYAILHFIRTRGNPLPADIGWDTGFRIAAQGLAHIAGMEPDSFLALLLAGILLGSVRAVLPWGLGYCMGLHAGWVFVIKAAKPLTHAVPDTEWGFLISPYDRVIGLLSSAWMVMLIVAFVITARRLSRNRRPVSTSR